MGQKRPDQNLPETSDGRPLCKHAKTKLDEMARHHSQRHGLMQHHSEVCPGKIRVQTPSSMQHEERRIYLHLNLKNRESPQLVVCPNRNHHVQPATSRDSTVIDVDDLPLPSRPPSRTSGPSRMRHPQLQSLRQAHRRSEKVPSPTTSNRSLTHFHAHEQATPWSCSELDLRYNLAFRQHDDDDEEQSQTGDGETGEETRPGYHMVEMKSSSIKMKSDVPLRVKGGSDITPHSESEPPGDEIAPGGSSSTQFPQTEAGAGVVLSWEGLTVTSKAGKVLLDDLNGQITSGFTAIMGPSGSGKSTLLNTLACRMGQSASIEGRILLNGRHYKIADLKKMSGYVMQDDLLNAHLTVEETLKYTTRLKLEPSLTEEEVSSRVDSIIKQMGLAHVRGTVIGSPEKRGISGGERKRVCVGMELLTKPELLFLDEPTSGLDSVTALSLCEQLQKLSSTEHCTIVCTIHQPQAKIFNLFHYLIILKAGQVIYQGKASEVLRFFEESGFPCPEYTNPADHFLDVITPSLEEARDSLRQIDDVLKSKFQALPVNMSEGSEYQVFETTRERMPWHRQYMVLLNRGVREQIRKKNVLITQLCQSMLCALLIGGVFFQIGDNQKSTVRRQPVLFFCVINQGVFGALTVINSFPGERVLTLRERAAGMYYCSSYFMAKITAEMASQIVSPILFSCIVYWMVGFQRSGSKFMIFVVLMVLCQLAATSLALMVSAICRTTDLSVTVLPMALEVNRLFGGFFLSPKSLPNYFMWLDALSYVKYTYTAISLNELHGLKVRCDPGEFVNGVCPITSGQQTIKSLGLDYLTIGSCVTILIFYILITRAVAYLGIRFLKK